MSLRRILAGAKVKRKAEGAFFCDFKSSTEDQTGNFILLPGSPPIEVAYGYPGLRLNGNYSAVYALKAGVAPLIESRPFTIELKICYWAYQTFRQEFILLLQGAGMPSMWLWKNVFQQSRTVFGINAGSENGGLVLGPSESNGVWKKYAIQRKADNTLQLFVNDVLVSSVAGFVTPLKITNLTLNHRSSPNTFEGWVRDFSIVDGQALY